MTVTTYPIPNGIAYLATPYALYRPSLYHAFIAATGIAAKLLAGGVRVYSPIVHCHPIATHGGLDPLDYSVWLPHNETMLEAAATLIVAHMDGWETSFGVAEEIRHFEAAGKPIFDLDPATMMMVKRRGVPAHKYTNAPNFGAC